MQDDPGIFVGKGEQPVYLLPRLANRHGLIAGATGTGKTVSLQILAEEFYDTDYTFELTPYLFQKFFLLFLLLVTLIENCAHVL